MFFIHAAAEHKPARHIQLIIRKIFRNHTRLLLHKSVAQQGAHALKEAGAKKIIACCTHGVFSGPAFERLEKSDLSEIIVLNTIEHHEALLPKIKEISVAPIFAEAIERIYADLPLSKLYE